MVGNDAKEPLLTLYRVSADPGKSVYQVFLISAYQQKKQTILTFFCNCMLKERGGKRGKYGIIKYNLGKHYFGADLVRSQQL